MEFLISGRLDQYKHCMIEAAMTKIEQNLKKNLKRFTLEFSQDFTYGTSVPVYDFSKDCILVNREITRCKGRLPRRVYALSDCFPQQLEFNVFDVMKRQRHLHWRINFTYHEYDINTGTIIQRRDFVGLGALLVKWG